MKTGAMKTKNDLFYRPGSQGLLTPWRTGRNYSLAEAA